MHHRKLRQRYGPHWRRDLLRRRHIQCQRWYESAIHPTNCSVLIPNLTLWANARVQITPPLNKPDRSAYTPLDFLQWREAGTLHISPKFQRRNVWSRAAQSFLIDTLLLGLPVPPIYLRIVQDASRRSMIREVVDGQQRISAVLDYLQDKYPLSKNIKSVSTGKRFSELTNNEKDAITQYSFICEVFYGVEDQTILEIFARLNTHSVQLNGQELRNGRYFGKFKQTAYALALEHLEFWRKQRIFTELAIARMSEVELTSELIIMMLNGIQDKKKSVDMFYERYDEEFSEQDRIGQRLRSTIDALTESVGDELSETVFRRVPLFYSLFSATYHRMYGVPHVDISSPKKGKLIRDEQEGLQSALRVLSNALSAVTEEASSPPPSYEAFVTACLRQTDNLRPRQIRLETIYRTAFA